MDKKRASLATGLIIGIAAAFLGFRVFAQGGTVGAQAENDARLRAEVTNVESTSTTAMLSTTFLWPTSEFPGVYSCVWHAYASNGKEVGEYSEEVYILPRQFSRAVDVPTTAEASSGDVECGVRIDVGGKYAYELSHIEVVDSETPVAPNGKVVRFQARWLGSGAPGVVTCLINISDGKATIFTSEPQNFYSAVQSTEPIEVPLSDPAINDRNSSSLSATIDCKPFTDSTAPADADPSK